MKPEALDNGHRIKAIIGGSIGNLVEWYDWYAYAAFAIYFSPVFFPNSNPTAQLLNTAGIFAVGFFMRPIGGWLFGSLADKAGRKKAMTLSVLLMSFGSLLIACSPTYASIGIAAPALLFIARMIQGLSVGGEYGTSATYLSEMATHQRKGFYSSFQYVTLIGGQLFALGIQLILQRLILTDAQLHQWGWRIPFFIGALLSVVAFYIRRNLHETRAYHTAAKSGNAKGTVRELLRYPKAIAMVVGLTLGGTIAFYTYSIYMQKFLVNTVHLTISQSTTISFVSLLLFACLQPVFGSLSDRIGRKPLLIGFGVLGTVGTYPLLTAISHTTSMYTAFGLIMAGLVIVTGYTSINAVVKAELFPGEVRALGVGLPYAVTTALFGGSAEYIALWFKNQGQENGFYIYVTACIFISLLIYVFMKDTRHRSLEE
ncbi:MAG TPA: MFS transporter [Flavisolibacter sp.]|jgi:MHS family alpha-ketoglutarate permease-like MFS transporter|nr:MFS transporter [Flavisolibacter sp.]